MFKKFLFIFFLFFILENKISNAQNYESVDENGKCEKYIGDGGNEKYCDGYLSNADSVYVGNITQIESLNNLKMVIGFLKTANPEKECINPTNFKIICSMLFPECIEVKPPNTSKVLSFPVKTCNSYCNQALSSCPATSLMASCSLDNPTAIFKYDTPLKSVLYNLTSFQGINNFTVDCANPTLVNSSSSEEIEVECIPPLIKRYTNDTEGDMEKGYFYVNSQCVLNCPITGLHPHSVWTNLFRIGDSLSIISLVCTLILLFTFGVINPKLNRFDKKNLFFIAGVFGMALSGVIIVANGSEKTVCPTPERFGVNTDRVCVASGFLVHFSALFAIQWWTISINDVRYGIKNVGKTIKIKIRYYLAFTLFSSFAFTLVPLGAGQYQAGLSNVICFLKSEIYQTTTFFVPLGLCLTLGTVLMILIMRDIYLIVRSSSSSNNNNKDSLSFVKLQFKPMLNILLFYFTFLYIFVFVRVINSRYDEYKESAVPYIICLVGGGGDTCKLNGPSAGSLGFFAYCLRIYGIYVFIISFLSSRTIQIWKESFVINNRFMLPIIRFIDSTFSRISSTTSTTNNNSSTTQGSSTNNNNNTTISTMSVELDSRHREEDDDL